MELEFKTLVKYDGENIPKHFKNNKYVKGRISGFMEVICGGHSDAMTIVENGCIMVTTCTQEKYDEFVEFTKRFYPNVCEFYYEA